MVLADTVQLDILPVEPEAGLSIKAEVAESGIGPHLVHHTPLGYDLSAHPIYIWMFRRPQTRVLDFRTHIATRSVENRVLDLIALSSHADINFHLAILGIGLDVDTRITDIDGFGPDKPDVAIDAASGIPARIGLVGIVDTHGNDVVATAQVAGNVVLERAVAIRSVAEFLAIDVDSGVHVDAIELDEVKTGIADPEMLAIPPHTTRQGSPTRPRGIGSQKVTFDCPVVRQVQCTPVGVIVFVTGHNGRISQNKTPTDIKQLPLASLQKQDGHQGEHT